MTLANRRNVAEKGIPCSERVYRSGNFRSQLCRNFAVVEYDQVYTVRREVEERIALPGWDGLTAKVDKTFEETRVVHYCPTHDPVRQAKRNEKRRAEFDQERERARRIHDDATVAVKLLGFGHAEYNVDHGFTGSVVIGGVSARRLAALIEAADAFVSAERSGALDLSGEVKLLSEAVESAKSLRR